MMKKKLDKTKYQLFYIKVDETNEEETKIKEARPPNHIVNVKSIIYDPRRNLRVMT